MAGLSRSKMHSILAFSKFLQAIASPTCTSLALTPQKLHAPCRNAVIQRSLEFSKDVDLFAELTHKHLLIALEEQDKKHYYTFFGKDGLEEFILKASCDSVVIFKMVYFLASISHAEDKMRFIRAMSSKDITKICQAESYIVSMFLECIQRTEITTILHKLDCSSSDMDDESLLAFLLLLQEKSQSEIETLFHDNQIHQIMTRITSYALDVGIMSNFINPNRPSCADRGLLRLLPYSYSRDLQGLWSARAYCPISLMEPIHRPNNPHKNRWSHNALCHQHMEAFFLLKKEIRVLSNYVELRIGIENLRFLVLPVMNNEKFFLSRAMIRITPKHCHGSIEYFKASKTTEDISRAVTAEKQLQGSITVPDFALSIKAAEKMSNTMNIYNWRFDQYECGINVGFMEWRLFDTLTGVDVISCSSSSMKMRDRRFSSPLDSQGGCVFSNDKYSHELIWRLNKDAVVGKTYCWEIDIFMWFTYSSNVVPTSFHHTVHHSISHKLVLDFPSS